ncbi:MAG: cytidylate kinase-like family protein [Bacteroidales bacterium]|nr:cytidylate kinase-like family protein [Bacteroidales bacterium]
MSEKRVIINIGRQFGSGGRTIAGIIGDKLGIKVYDRELLIKAAEHSGFSASLFEKSDEKRRLWGISNIFGVNRYGSAQSALNDSELFRIQSEAIRGIAADNDAIFIGRAADYVLRDMDCLDVFICAPLEVRREFVAGREGVSPEKAEAIIEKRDRARAEFYNFFTFEHWGKAAGYDLCIDSSILGMEGTADFIIDFGRKAGKI